MNPRAGQPTSSPIRSRPSVCAVAVLALALAGGSPAAADTAPASSATPATVSADVLPTVQINGVVWAQVVVGSRVYATGSFTRARPAGAPAGTSETVRSNLLAYDLATGQLVTSWAPSLNAQGMAIAASTDGSTIFVAGDFTTVSGVARSRFAALDAATGAVRGGFSAGLNGRARALAVSASAVYVGGSFTTAGGQPRSRLAAFSTASGGLLSWAPAANSEVWALTVPPGSNKVVTGGRFTTLAGASNYGLGAVTADGGAPLGFSANSVIRDAGTDAAITSLSSDAGQVYGTGYVYGPGGNLEGTFAARASDGALVWVNGCKGDSYDSQPIGPVLYSVSHAHDCGMVRGHPQANPWTYQRAMASTTARAADGRLNTYGNFTGRPASELLHWLPTLDAGAYTGQYQAAWSVKGNAQYVVLGGEFPKINGVAQQGLARFAVSSLAPNREGPRPANELTPTLSLPTSTSVRISWKAAWDRDNRRLTYEVLRGATTAGSTVVAQIQADSNWWSRPAVSATDSTPPTGSVTYRVRVRDAFGNSIVGPAATITR